MPKHCLHCGTQLLANARFCHACGESAEPAIIQCQTCGSDNPREAKFCANCGSKLHEHNENINPPNPPQRTPRYNLDFGDLPTLPTQLKTAFLQYLRQALDHDGETDKLPQYEQAFEDSGFRQAYFEEQALAWTVDFEGIYTSLGREAFARIESELERYFADSYTRFLVQYAQTLTPTPLSNRILFYLNKPTEQAKISSLIADFLDLDNEKESFYTQVIEIPLKKLKNAQESFFQPLYPNEIPLLFIDQTVWGSGRDGLILTEHALYWKAAFHRPAFVPYRQLQTLRRFNTYIEINGIYLNVSPTFNYKLLKMLQKVQQLRSIHAFT